MKTLPSSSYRLLLINNRRCFFNLPDDFSSIDRFEFNFNGCLTFNLGFHVFAVEWDEGSITWLVDSYAYQTVTPADLPRGATWVYDHPFFVILNVAVGGNWVGAPDESTVFPQAMLVDHVRVYGPLR